MTTDVNTADVIVVGGGPVGVAMALLCEQRGLHTVVFERSTEIYDLPRAIVMDDEIQRVFQGAGLIDGLHAITSPMAGAEFLSADGTQIIGIELPVDGAWPLGHHPVVRYYQPELEAFLRDQAAAAGVELRLGVNVGAVDQDHESAWVDVSVDGTTQRHHARWVVAADGASSPTRKSLGIAFVDQGSIRTGWSSTPSCSARATPDCRPSPSSTATPPDRPRTCPAMRATGGGSSSCSPVRPARR
jgi:3-(3-hydroxy-phenyl)propionate hydroxylase